MKVIKRDGRIENYDYSKIAKAVKGAALDVNETPPTLRLSFDKDEVSVDEIHDAVETHLMRSNPKVAKEYILYRQHRNEVREGKSELMGKVGKLVAETSKDNANTGTSAASKMYGIAEAASKTYFLEHMDKRFADNHRKGRIYIHDLGYRSLTFNCFFSPIGEMLKHGFDNGVGTIRSPKRIGSAVALVAIILQSMQNDLFGGQGVLHFDTDLAPYVTKEFEWQQRSYPEKAWERTEQAVYQAMEAFVYNMNTMRSRSGAQVTFSSVNFGTDTSKEARMISKALLKAYMAGLGHGENPIFPNLCYRVQRGVNLEPNDPNFDITQLAIECVGKRIQPRFVFVDSDAYTDKANAGTMGCADGNEIIAYKYKGKFYCNSIERMWNTLSEDTQKYGDSYYIVPDGLDVWDGENGFVNVKTAVMNCDHGDWTRVTFDNGRSLLVTSDHPLYTENRGRIFVKDIKKGDEIKAYYDFPTIDCETDIYSTDEAYILGILIADGCYSGNSVTVTFDSETEQDIINKFCGIVKRAWGKDTGITQYRRGYKGNYDMVRIKGKPKELCEYLAMIFGGVNKIGRSIPSDIFECPRNVRLAFIGGLIDADGHINHKSKVQLGSTNKELALQQLALAQSVGVPAKLYLNHYDSKDKTKIRYRIEFSMVNDLVPYISSDKKTKKQWNGNESLTRTPETVKVAKVEPLGFLGRNSYDIETDTDKFTLSFVRSGNCRTSVRGNVNGESTGEARGNLAFNTMNLPYFALEAGGDIDKFKGILAAAVDDAIAELLARYDIIKSLKVKDVPFVAQWYQGHEGLSDNDSIEPMVKNGSLSVGFIGLAECLIALTGKHHGESKESQELGLEVIGYIRKRTDEATEKYHLNFSTFATPAESACYTLLKAVRKEFGVVPGVSDKDYFTNSVHIPVSFDCDMKTKIDIEAPYHLLCNAGAIFYIEAPSTPKFNPQGVLKTIQYMAQSGIVYGGLNYENDFCKDCGFTGTFDGACPKCGGKNIRVVKIVTGYLSTLDKFNEGKLAEAADRTSHVGGGAL